MSSSFGQRLKSARIMAGLSMDALVAKMGHLISKQAVSKYENGIMLPDSRTLLALADALSVKPDYFFAQRQILIDEINFRKKAAASRKSIASLEERIKDELERYLELESLFPQSAPLHNTMNFGAIRNLDDIEAAALQLRDEWGVGKEGPIASVVDLLEEHDIKVIEIGAPSGIDGMSGKAGEVSFIILDKNAPSDRKRLTALHEFAHLFLSFDPAHEPRAQEKLCHSFGAAFLMPRDVLVRELGANRSDISFAELKALKEQYGISMQAILYRARQQGIISQYVYERLMKQMSAFGWRKEEPGEYPVKEKPQRFDQLLHRAISEEFISISKASFLANKPIERIRLERILGDAPAHS